MQITKRGVTLLALGTAFIFAVSFSHSSNGGEVMLKNGMQLSGRLGKIAKMGENPLDAGSSGGEVKVRQIVLVDDELRRTFVSSMQTRTVAEGAPDLTEKIEVKQRIALTGRRIGAVGPIIRITPFDEWGRRIFSMRGPKGQIDVVQGITEVTPTYTRVQGLLGRDPYIWDMRIATSSIPREVLSKVLIRQMDPQNPDHRLRLVRLYIQAERDRDADAELKSIIADFPELSDLEKQRTALQQANARRMIAEIKLRSEAGQHPLAKQFLAKFPEKGVSSESLIQVREMLTEYKAKEELGKKILELFDKQLELADANIKEKVAPIRAEIGVELGYSTLARMADFVRLGEDDKLAHDQKLALAISGWVLGVGEGDDNLAVALSLYEVRNLASEYLRPTTRAHERDIILDKIKSQEGGTPANLARILKLMKPPVPVEQEPVDGVPGMFEFTTPGLIGQPDITYYVQLPPFYNPNRRYPTIVTLNGAGTSPKLQVDWWAGAYNENLGVRLGQAARRGYIVVAPVWSRPHQTEYEYSAREHSAVLYSLRGACERFSVDTDRVFLTGHSMGGNAAWDIALAHPDLWAGAIPVVATADKYISRYWENAKHVSMYFVMGEMDGDRMSLNSREFDRYLTRVGYDTMIVQYQGRGHEDFYDEIQRFFEWMELHEREFTKKDFEVASMRSWDNFFWWVELDKFPARSITAPLSWPPHPGSRPAMTDARILENNGVHVSSGADDITVYLTPDMVDFDLPVVVNGRRVPDLSPDSEVILEDARTRVDRAHPFWAKVKVGRR